MKLINDSQSNGYYTTSSFNVFSIELLQNNFLAIGSNDGVKILNTVNKNIYKTLYSGRVYSLHLINCNYLAAGISNSIIIWDILLDFQVKKDQTPAHSDLVQSLRSNQITLKLFSGSKDHNVKVWNLFDMSLNKTISTSCEVNAIELLPNDLLAYGCINTGVFIYDLKNNLLKPVLPQSISDLRSLKLLNNGLLAAGFKQSIQVWNVSNSGVGIHVGTYNGPTDFVLTIESIDENYFAAGTLDQKLFIWHVSNPTPLKTINFNQAVYGLIIFKGLN